MSLSDFLPETKDIVHKGKTLVTVRGLNLEDLGIILRNHVGDIRAVFDLIGGSGKLLPSATEADAAIFSLVVNAPETVAKVIAIASGEPDKLVEARRLSAPLQIQILTEVVKLTFEDFGGPLEFSAALSRLMGIELRDELLARTIQ